MSRNKTLFFALLVAASQVVACGASKSARKNNRSGGSGVMPDPHGADAQPNSNPQSDTKSDGGPVRLADIPVAVGVRNFAQINETMGVLTGVSPANTVVATSFADLSTQLPLTNDVRSFVAAHQVAATKLAVEYCDQLFENATLRAQVIPNFNFAAIPAAAFTPQNKDLVVTALLDRFWGKDIADRPSNDTIKPDLVLLLNGILQGKNQNNAALTRNAVKGVCTAVLASAPVLFY